MNTTSRLNKEKFKRTGIAMTTQTYARLKEVTTKFDISQAKFIECMLAFSDDDIKAQIEKVLPAITVSKKEIREKTRLLSVKMATMSPEKLAQIEALLAAE